METGIDEYIFSPAASFTEKALRAFAFQYAGNPLYERFAGALNCRPGTVRTIGQIPFLPISFFKSHNIATSSFTPEVVFESSGTTGSVNSRHLVRDAGLYEKSFVAAFEAAYGPITDYCILGLLPSYLERGSSSLVYMVKRMIEISGHPQNGFYLYDHRQLAQTLQRLEGAGQKALLIGVTYALLDFAEAFPMPLHHTIVMETGGMKGRKKELLRDEVHALLQGAFGLAHIHSEYGMTELLSQAYSKGHGRFYPPSWMRVLVREEDDPLAVAAATDRPLTGALNIIDLANLYSCSFIATEDVGRLYPDGSFEVLGRMDASDVRGCSLMVADTIDNRQ
ncbi:acyl transferase [Paraflavisolibacter sp. H34]|uniref:acyl transferase n=1 Tax=Huijunlia imazamoxiresistens TaxID=3127457 RepID=UPI003018A18F